MLNESKITHRIMQEPNLMVGAYEVKVTKTGRLPFDRLLSHQHDALLRTKHNGYRYKIRDEGFEVQGKRMGSQKGFDFFVLRNFPAFVLVAFIEKERCDCYYRIDIDTWVLEQERSKAKSLTESRANDIGTRVSLTKEKEERPVLVCTVCGKETKQVKDHNGRPTCYQCIKKLYEQEN